MWPHNLFHIVLFCLELSFTSANFFELNKDEASRVNIAQQNCCSNDKIITNQKIMCNDFGLDTNTDFDGLKVIPSSFSKFPWQVSIQQLYIWRSAHICSGSVISSKWVLSVANCVYKLTSDQIQVVDGNNKKSSVARIIIHPSFVAKTLENDVVLLKLVKSLELTDAVSAVCIKASSNDIPCNNHCQLGIYLNHQYSRMKLPLLDKEKCKTIYQTYDLARMVKANMQCSENPSLDKNCYGDPGAVIACPNSRGQIQLTGLQSWGWNCAGVSTPAVFTKVSPFNQFIKNIVNSSNFLCQKDSDLPDETHIDSDGIRINIVIPRKKIEFPEYVEEETSSDENENENEEITAFPSDKDSSVNPLGVKFATSKNNLNVNGNHELLLSTSATEADVDGLNLKESEKEQERVKIHFISKKEFKLDGKNFIIFLNLTKLYSTK